MRTIKTLLAGIYLLSGLSSYGQGSATNALLPDVLPSSPSSAAFSKFGNYQVNLFTGLPEINIPLYEVKVGELSIPISINYHASGIQVTDWGSWVGLGWALDAGGSVSRTMQGKPDEGLNGYFSNTTYKDDSSIHTTTQNGLDYLSAVYLGHYDTDPDVFSYNFPGKSGKFVFNNQDGFNAVTMPYDPVVISKSPMFDITDERGVQYQFRVAEDSYNDNTGTDAVSTWLLSKMYSASKKDSITIKYAPRTGYSSQTGFDYTDFIVLNDNVTDRSTTCDHNPYTYDLGNGYTSNNGIYVDEQWINEIDFRGGKVVFDTSVSDRQDGYPGQKALTDIKVYSYNSIANSYTLIKTIYFYQSYFNPSGAYDTKRMRLDSLGIAGSDGVVIEKYKFTYNSSITLPNKTSRSRDFWGYYNGKSNTTLVPHIDSIPYQSTAFSTPGYISLGGAAHNRDVDTAYMQMGMLQSIYYPTGGHTDFKFETNVCYDENFNVIFAGGLRVASIKSYDGISATPIVKSYKYGGNESGIGRSNYLLPYHFNSVSQDFYYYDNPKTGTDCGPDLGCQINTGIKRVRTYYCTPSIGEIPYDQAPVVYDTVTEYIGDNSSNIGKTVYIFSDHADGLNTTMMMNKPVVTTYYMDRGHLLNKTEYVNKGTYFSKAHVNANLYGAYAEHFYENIGLAVFKKTISQDPNDDYLDLNPVEYPECYDDGSSYLHENYSLRTADNKLKETIDSTFDQLDSTKVYVTKTDYYYDNFAHQQVTRVYTTDSKGDSIKIFKQYPADKGATAPYNTMASLNIQAKEVQSQQYKNNTQILQTNNNYADMGNSNYLPANISEQVLANPAETRAYFTQYDNLGNIQQMQKSSDEKMSIIWGYNQVYPVAKVDNAKFSDVAYSSFESADKGNWTYSGTPVADNTAPTGKYAYNLTSHSITKSGLSSSTTYIVSYWSKINESYTVNGTTSIKTGKAISMNGTNWTYYEHTVTGVTNDTVSGGAEIDELRLYPATAQMTTFTYTPLVGMTSQCDLNNRITYYQYDNYNRLSVVRDQDWNVIKKICYNYYNQPDACANTIYYSVTKSGTFTRNNCTGGYIGSTVTYTVAAGTYSATSQAAADALAQNDVNTNGQAYANAHGTCTAPPNITITSANNVGVSGFTVKYHNTVTSTDYTFTIPSSSTATLGTVPQGTYNITFTKSGNSTLYFFGVCSTGGTVGYTGVVFSNVSVSADTCNGTDIDSAD